MFQIIDPWGQIIASLPKYTVGVDTNEGVAVAEIDLDLVKKIRREMPCFQHRRNDVYDLCPVNIDVPPLNDNDNFKFADKIIPGSTVFYRSKHSYAFTNIRCVVPGRILKLIFSFFCVILKALLALTKKNRVKYLIAIRLLVRLSYVHN